MIDTTDIKYLGMTFIVEFKYDPDEHYTEVTKIWHKDEDIFPLFEEGADTIEELERLCLEYVRGLGYLSHD